MHLQVLERAQEWTSHLLTYLGPQRVLKCIINEDGESGCACCRRSLRDSQGNWLMCFTF
jgi:hypothetical protein